MIIYIHNSLPFESGKSCILSLLRDILASNLYTYSIALLNGKCLESLRVRTKASLNRNNPYTADTWNTLKITNILISMCFFLYWSVVLAAISSYQIAHLSVSGTIQFWAMCFRKTWVPDWVESNTWIRKNLWYSRLLEYGHVNWTLI